MAMSKFYYEPELIVHKYDLQHSIFTSGGDKTDDDIFDDITVNSSGDDSIFGD